MYGEPITKKDGNATVIIYPPILTAEEHQERVRELEDTLSTLLKRKVKIRVED